MNRDSLRTVRHSWLTKGLLGEPLNSSTAPRWRINEDSVTVGLTVPVLSLYERRVSQIDCFKLRAYNSKGATLLVFVSI